MNALVLNGERQNENMLGAAAEVFRNELASAGWQADSILLREKKIAPCTGCFGCWLKSPGICVIDDYGREVARMAAGCDLVILLTPVTFGGYSSELKKAFDRYACSMLLPYFIKINGEVHHPARYTPLFDTIAIGVLPGPDAESESIFRKLVERNAVNMHSSAATAVFYSSQDEGSITREVRSLLVNVQKRK